MKREDFIKQFVKIEYLEDEGVYGYHPFAMHIEKDGENEFHMLAGLSSAQLFKVVRRTISKKDVKLIHLAIDCLSKMDITDDFVAVYTIQNSKEIEISAIPYDVKSGDSFEEITSAKFLDAHKQEIIKFFNGVES